MSAISGFGGRVVVVNPNASAASAGSVATAMPAGRWTVSIRGNTVDVSTFEHGDMYDYMVVGREYDVSFDCFWDTAIGPLTSSVDLFPGGLSMSQLKTYKVSVALDYCANPLGVAFRDANARYFFFPKFLVEQVSIDSEVRGVIKYSISGKGTREVVFAQGSAPTYVNVAPTIPVG